MTDQEIREAEERAEKATSGPWGYNRERQRISGPVHPMPICDVLGPLNSPGVNADADFIAHAREDIPKLCKEARRLEKRWAYIKANPEGARHMLSLLSAGKGSEDDFDAVIGRIIASKESETERAAK